MRTTFISSRVTGRGFVLVLALGLGNSARAAIVNATVTAPGDQIYAVAASSGSATSTTATPSGSTGQNSYPFPAGSNNQNDEGPSHAIDQATAKFLSFEGTSANIAGGTFGGIVVTPSAGPTRLTSVQFTTGNDSSDRDPLAITIEGTNTAIASGIAAGGTITASWTPIYSGPSGIPTGSADPGRNAVEPAQTFVAPVTGFSSYRVLVTGVRGDGTGAGETCCFQFDEINLVGSSAPAPEPATLGLGTLAAAGLGLLRRRRSAN